MHFIGLGEGIPELDFVDICFFLKTAAYSDLSQF